MHTYETKSPLSFVFHSPGVNFMSGWLPWKPQLFRVAHLICKDKKNIIFGKTIYLKLTVWRFLIIRSFLLASIY